MRQVAFLQHKKKLTLRGKDVTKDNKDSGFVPPTDDNGMRKTFVTPELPEVKKRVTEPKYPFATIKVGESFPIMYSEMKPKSVWPYASKMSKKYNKKFRVTNHPEWNCYLISCLPMTDTEAVQKSSNVVEALNNTSVPNTGPIVKMVSREEAEEYAKLHNISLFEAKLILEKGE